MKKIILFFLLTFAVSKNATAEYVECIKISREEQKIKQELDKKIEAGEELTPSEYAFSNRYMDNYNKGVTDFCYDKADKLVFFRKNTPNEIQITEEKYNFIMNNIESYKDTHYLIDYSSLKNDVIEPCYLYNFNQDGLTEIYFKWDQNTRNTDFPNPKLEHGFAVYFDKNGKKIQANVTNAQFDKCDDVDIKDCRGTACLNKLPNQCYFLLTPNGSDVCFNLKTHEIELMWIVCDNKFCERRIIPFEFNV